MFGQEITGRLGLFGWDKAASAKHDQFHKNSFMGQMQQFYCTSKWPRKFEFAGPFAPPQRRHSGTPIQSGAEPPSSCRKFKSTG